MLVREAFEYECLGAARSGNVNAFNSSYARLHTYYTDFSGADVPASSRHMLLVGLNLISLLVQNRISEFHAQLEIIPSDQHSSMYIKPVVELERYLMEGSYTKLLQARATVPTNDYEKFLDKLTETVSTEIARCMSHSYNNIKKGSAAKLLMVKGTSEVDDIIAANDWKEEGGMIRFSEGPDAAEASRTTVNFHAMMDDQLGIAHELQRIV
jgi:26S proteasome regulatory subunit N12